MYDFLNNKTVALVGPAASLKGQGQGEYIDSHDFVVRINYAKIQSVMDSGSRTDMIYYDGSYHDYSRCSPKILVCSYPETEWFFESRCKSNVEKFKYKYEHYIVDSNLYNSLKLSLDSKLKVRPNSGTIAIVDLLNSNLNRLYITGIDFYRSSYLNTHPDYGGKHLREIKSIFATGDNGDYHDTEKQFDYFKNELIKDKRVEVDKFLEKILLIQNKEGKC
tara:strand:- start:624 stop:1283 length:660 start_codon:yes stop_codon:yes gene_type:complete